MARNTFKLTALSAAVLMGLTACGGDGDTNFAPDVSAQNIDGGLQWVPVTGQVTATDANNDSLSFSASVVASEGGETPGTVSIDGSGHFSYIPLTTAPATISISVSDGQETTTAQVQVSGIAGDPLAYQQWHLRNTGQKAYAQSEEFIAFLVNVLGWPEEQARANFIDDSVSVAGNDMNVIEAHAQGAYGQGMMVAVVDSGLEINHPDLQANIAPNKSLNFIPGASNKMDPTSNSVYGDHGTSVGGLIAAVAGNEEGGRGVAPQAQLFGLNFLGGQGTQTMLNLALSHGLPGSGVSDSDPVVAYNRSYGISLPFALYTSVAESTYEQYTATALRNGLGAVNVKSAGNAFNNTGNAGLFSNICSASGAAQYGLTCLNGNLDPSNANFFTTTVAAVNADGTHTSYSTAGSNVFVAAPAGEYGEIEPAMVTTDQSTCLQGYSGFPYQDAIDSQTGIPGYFAGTRPFNAPGHPENPNCNYTSTFNGTSSAAPNASGVVALIGSANPALSAREIRHVLANTSTQVDAEDPGVVIPAGSGEFVADPGWIENAAGYAFNLKYGFGRVDAGAAVSLAKEWQPGSLGQLLSTGWMSVSPEQALEIPDNNAEGVSYSFTVDGDLTLEGIQVQLTVSNDDLSSVNEAGEAVCGLTTAGNDLAIELTSPAGTTTQLLSGLQALNIGADGFCSDYILENTTFLANAFYGENLRGEWTIRLVDVNGDDLTADARGLNLSAEETFSNNSVPSVFEHIDFRAFGHQ